jgi:hypothetical protein
MLECRGVSSYERRHSRDLDLTVKRRDERAIRVALDDVRCPRCNSYRRTRDGATALSVD